MDYADDIAYSVHDIFDFYRAGLLPLGLIAYDDDEVQRFAKNWEEDKNDPIPAEVKDNPDKYRNLVNWMLVSGEYKGSKENRASIKEVAADRIAEYVREVSVDWGSGQPHLKRSDKIIIEIKFLKRIFSHYLIDDPRLRTMQHGYIKVIKDLFEIYYGASKEAGPDHLIPDRFRHHLKPIRANPTERNRYRLAADIVASFTDAQALTMFGRLRGTDPGSISDIVVW